MKLKGKAENLDILVKIFKRSNIKIPKYFYFSIKEYKKSKNSVINRTKKILKKNPIIIRSSSIYEDKNNLSNAGKYNSKIVKKHLNKKKLKIILNEYLKQFKSNNDKIIVQKLIDNVSCSGVIFTKDINLNSPYYSINYDNSGKTNLITSGLKNDNQKSLIIYKNYKKKLKKFNHLIKACRILEKKINNDRLDVEFCIKNKITYLFQVRNLPLPRNKYSNKRYLIKDFDNFLLNIEKKIKKLKNKNPTLPGKDTFFSNMADWNPAEMIDDKPYPLALSLYKELITDNVWREQRTLYGYKNAFPNALMFSFAGSPYIDLRTDLYSFLPNSLDQKSCHLIIDKYQKIISRNPEIHDKIEFELIETCFSFGTYNRLKKNFSHKISKKYRNKLKEITKKIISENQVIKEKEKIYSLSTNIKKIYTKNISDIQKIYYLIEITKKYGTLPFSGLARCAFISQRILLDLKQLGLINEKEFKDFFSSLKSITSNFNNDFLRLSQKKISKNQFLNKYGHLRPSTYDISSLNYREGFDLYFSLSRKVKKIVHKKIKFKNKNKIEKLFKNNFNFTFLKFLNFAKQSIILREEAKFIFTKEIDNIFKSLISLGNEIGIKRNDLAFLDIKNIINFYSSLEARKLKESLKYEIEKNKFEYDTLKVIKLPDIIKSSNDIYFFEENINKANFITTETIFGEVVELKRKNLKFLKDKIVFIKNADPGYDYIFNHKIKGIVTQYGGANSHMAIRCLELNIPAVIGLGKFKFDYYIESKKIFVNCNKKIIQVIK
jgi:phosphohistidine swiveling domain-containing protein